MRDKLPLIERPTLVICGREDKIVDPLAVQDAVKDLPNYRFVMVPKCGHAPQLEYSSLINRMVRDFLNLAEPTASAQPVALHSGLQGG